MSVATPIPETASYARTDSRYRLLAESNGSYRTTRRSMSESIPCVPQAREPKRMICSGSMAPTMARTKRLTTAPLTGRIPADPIPAPHTSAAVVCRPGTRAEAAPLPHSPGRLARNRAGDGHVPRESRSPTDGSAGSRCVSKAKDPVQSSGAAARQWRTKHGPSIRSRPLSSHQSVAQRDFGRLSVPLLTSHSEHTRCPAVHRCSRIRRRGGGASDSGGREL